MRISLGHQLQHGRHFSFVASVLRHVRDQIIPGIKVPTKAPSKLGRRDLRTQLYFYDFHDLALRGHTNPSRKRRFLKTLFKPEEFVNAGFTF